MVRKTKQTSNMETIQIFTLGYRLKTIFLIEENTLSIYQLLDRERLRLE